MEGVGSDVLFKALTRLQMVLGVPYGFIIGNVIVVAELFLLTKSFWVLAIGIAAHCAGWLACLREPRLIDIWLVRIRRTPRNRNFAIWRCNSYRP